MRLLPIICLLSLGCLAQNAYARSLLQGKPDLCDQNSGSWDPYDINCDFDCGANGWEVDCECDDEENCTEIKCKVDKDKAPDSEDVYFYCKGQDGSAPDCDFADLETIDDACVVETVKSVLKAWNVGA
eukprot:jgi/Picsp_1/3074/NSC_01296-R1_---NA---